MGENHSYGKSKDFITVFDTSKSVLQEIPAHLHGFSNVELWIKRDDLIDDEVSGNKWRKLVYNVELAISLKKEGILTFGGAYSNHLLATASACNRLGLKSIGIVRGEELVATSNPNLARCAALGMDLHFVSRSQYDCRCEETELESWKERFPSYLLVPEGGANYHGIIGCQQILMELPFTPNQVFVAQGTTATSCGILLSANEATTVHVVPVLKGFDALAEMRPFLFQVLMDQEAVEEYMTQVVVHSDAHFGGYGKWNQELVDFISEMNIRFNLPLDKVYTGKAFHALWEWLSGNVFEQETKVVFIHTGGLKNA